MANALQATFVGGEIIYECNGDWGCCQREQAANKVRQMNAAIAGQQMRSKIATGIATSPTVRSAQQMAAPMPGGDPLDVYKQKVANRAGDRFKKQNKTAAAKAADAKNRGAADCLQKEFAAGKNPKVEMDHPLECKLGGDPQVKLTPLDPEVNGAFGGVAKTVGDKMGAGTPVEKVSLVCPPSPPGCPAGAAGAKDNSVGPRTTFPGGPNSVSRTTSSTAACY